MGLDARLLVLGAGIVLSSTKRALLEALRQGAGSPTDQIRPRPLGERPLMSFAQERVWTAERLIPGTPIYTLALSAQIDGPLEPERLQESMQRLVARHDVLRSAYPAHDGAPLHVVLPHVDVEMPLIDLSGLPSAEREEQLKAMVEAETARPIDVTEAPLFRVRLVRLGELQHVLLLALHHIVSDAWSFGLLGMELWRLYLNDLIGIPEPPPPELQYADFAAWQRRWLDGDEAGRKREYWTQHLSGAPPVMELPVDLPRPSMLSYRGSTHSFTLPPSELERLKETGRRTGATLSMVMLAAYLVLLSRHSGQTDVVVGVPVMGRRRSELADVIGCFINTLVLRTDLSGDPSFEEVLGRVRKVVLDGYANEDFPLEKLVEVLRPPRDPSRQPVFQFLYNFRPDIEQPMIRAGSRSSTEDLPTVVGMPKVPVRTSQGFDLVLDVAESEGGLVVAFEYNTDLFEPASVQVMAGHLEHILLQAAASTSTHIGDLELPPAPASQLKRVVYSGPAGLHQLFEEQVRRAPHAVAVAQADERLTYDELERRANQLARHIRRLGVRRGDAVGVCVERSPAMIVALLAVLKAGAAYLPVDPGLPAERIAFMIADAGARLAVTHSRHGAVLPPTIPVAYVDDASLAGLSEDRAAADVDPDDAAYVMFTSGSTGRPKGVVVPHRGIRNRVLWTIATHLLDPADVFLQRTAFTFDASVWEVFAPLAVGARLVLAGHGRDADPAHLAAQIQQNGVTVLQVVPSLLQMLIDEPGFAACRSLRHVFCAGEVLAPALAQRFFATVGAQLHNTYGPTECSVDATCWDCGADDRGARVAIGVPLPNVEVYVLDRKGRRAPTGVVGDLFIGGEGVGRGYSGRPGLTADRFVPNPGGQAGARMYRTGDLARHLPDGSLEFWGRTDNQMKLHGFRVELEEVEAVVGQHPEVARAAAVVAGSGFEAQLLAFVVVAPGVAADGAGLREFLRSRLPEPMVPSRFIFLPTLPTLGSGKVDRRALASLEVKVEREAVPALPRNPTEEALCALWCEVLKIEQVGIHDSFFDLGGQSLTAVQLVARIRQRFGVDLPLPRLFEKPTVAGLAEAVAATSLSSTTAGIPKAARGLPLPLSYAQERIWFLEQLVPGQPYYNVPLPLRLRGPLDLDALEVAMRWLVARHEILRTRFEVADGQPVQIVESHAPVEVTVDDLEGVPEPDRDEALSDWLQAQISRLFDLGRAPLFRAAVARLGGADHLLVLTAHHLITDAWSTQILLGELLAAYSAFAGGRQPGLPEPDLHYADYAVWQKGRPAIALDEMSAYWRRELEGAPRTLDVPADHPRPPVQSFDAGHLFIAFSETLTRAIREFSVREGVTPFMSFLAALEALLYRLTGQGQILIGAPVAGRLRPELESVPGCFLNTLVLRGDVRGGESFRELLAGARRATVDGLAHQEMPFEKLVDALQAERDLSRTPLFQVLLNYQELPGQGATVGGIEVLPVLFDPPATRCDLVLTVYDTGNDLLATVDYSRALFEPESISRIAARLERLLECAVANPERRVSELDIMDGAELAEVLPPASTMKGTSLCLHELFERQVRRSPTATAVTYEGTALTYRELDRRADLLARRLRRLGARPDCPVALQIGPSLELVVALIGILKSGSAYVPIDPELPKARLDLVLEDTQTRLLITTSFSPPTRPVRTGLTTIFIDDEDVAGLGGVDTDRRAGPDNLAYVIYTSGSTGRPKGVGITHRNVTRLFKATESWLDAGRKDVWTLFHSYAFDFSVWEMWGALLHGGRLVVVPEWTRRSPERFHRLLAEEGVTVLNQTPSAFYELANADARPHAPALPELRMVIFGGEALDFRRLRPWFDGHGDDRPRLVNMYGITETTVHVTTRPVSKADLGPPSSRIGEPLPDLRLVVLDRDAGLAPIGTPGEVFVGGSGLARGYLGRPALTAERFVPDPFGDNPGGRLYRTGDLARRLDGKDLEFLGRVDNQVKLRGFRIELGEVESVLAEEASVGGAAVLLREDTPGEPRLTAYVSPALGQRLDAAALRSYLRIRLPEHMVPSDVVLLDRLPLTPNGKVDRRALPPPSPRPDVDVGFAAPVGPLEQAMAGLWCDLLQLDQVGALDNFFDLGGHSLLAARLVTRIRDLFQVELPLRTAFEYPTVRGLARSLLAIAPDPGKVSRIAELAHEVSVMGDTEVLEALAEPRSQ